jgi:hypothetical protein
MKVNELEITLQSKNHGRKHSFLLMELEGKVILVVGGKKVASLHVDTMEKEVKDDEGDYHTKPSDDFYIQFEAVEAVCKKECAAVAFVYQPTSV